ncbi:MAG TPA: DUF2478 domain-containing protein [Kaistia sp.]|nr:DUF2478 domain-containing protein [Kaistia sp.]
MPTGRRPITAIVYDDGPAFEAFLNKAADGLERDGHRLAGLVQQSVPRPGRRKCDMVLRDLATGTVHRISEDRGAEARGCSLDTDLLHRACAAAETGLSARTALLVLCKFGKVEAAGGGVRGLLAAALELGVPVLIGVPSINRQPFEDFAGDLARMLQPDMLDPAALQELVQRSTG